MRDRVVVVLCLCLALISFSGCPSEAGFTVALGNWLFAIPGTNDHLGLGIVANGETNSYSFNGGVMPVGAGAAFEGSLSWQQVGNSFTMVETSFGLTLQWAGTLQSATYMTGTVQYGTAAPVPFTASKAPSENLNQ